MQSRPRYPGVRITANGNQLVSYHTETRIADAGVFYPITPSTEGGELYQQAFAEGKLNAFGRNTIAIEAEGEHAAQGGAIAHSVCGKRVVNYTSGQGVVYGVEQYYHAPGKCSTMVLEVAARALTKHALNVHCGHDDVYGALDTGWIIVFGKDAQQAADQALILRRVTELSLTPGMNVMDGFLTSHLERTFYKHESALIREYLGAPEDIIDCPTESQRILFGPRRRRVPKMIDLTNPVLLGPVQNQEHYMQGVVARRDNFTEPILDFFEAAYKDFGELTGRYYGLVTEYKTDDTDTVFVSLGSAAENIEAAVDYLREHRGVTVGSIHLNVFRPFPEAAVVKALAGKKNVIVLERTDEPMAGDNPMGRDIRTALNKALQGEAGLPTITADQMPRLFAGVYGLGSRDFRPEHTIGAYEFATGARARKDGKRASDGASFMVLGVDHPYEVKSDDTPSLLPDKAIAVRFHSVGGWGAITTGKNLGAIIGDLNDLLYERDKVVDEFGNPKEIIHVSANPKYGSEKKGAPTSYFMIAAPERIRVNCDLRHVNVVLCCDPKAFTHTNPLDGMSEGGCLVWESDEEGEAAWERLPLWARKLIIDKNIRVFTLPGFKIAREATDRGDLQLRMQGNAFLGAFFSVSPMLQDFRITPEQFRDAVHKQYVKKFGKLGEGVVTSNMEVMTKGFELVREIKVGELEAADRSTLRGKALLPMAIPESIAASEGCGTGCRTIPPPADQPARPPLTRVAEFDAMFRAKLGYNQPANAYAVARHHGRGQRRHRVEVRRAPRNAALHPRELHAVHGVHRGLPRHGAAELLAGSRHDSLCRGHQLRQRQQRAPEDAARCCRRSASRRASGCARRWPRTTRRPRSSSSRTSRTRSTASRRRRRRNSSASSTRCRWRSTRPTRSLRRRRRRARGRAASSRSSSRISARGARPASPRAASTRRCGWCRRPRRSTPSTKAAPRSSTCCPIRSQKYLGLYNDTRPQDSKTATLRNMLMVRKNYDALVSGDGACAGCGEKSILRAVAAVTEAYMRPLYHAKADRFRRKADELEKAGEQKLAELKARSQQEYELFRQAVAHMLMGLGGEDDKDTKGRMAAHGPISDTDIIGAITAVLRHEAFIHKNLQPVDGRAANGMSVMAMAAHTGCNTVYGSTPPNNPHPYPWMNSLFQDGITVGWLLGESFIVDHGRRSVIPERLTDASDASRTGRHQPARVLRVRALHRRDDDRPGNPRAAEGLGRGR